MSEKKINEDVLYDIGNAIRTKLGTSTTYKPSQMPSAIDSISSYPEPTGSISITENGSHNVKDKATAVVNVPNSYAETDEGKVVYEGELVVQTNTSIDANGVYDTTRNNQVTVNVSNSLPSANGVSF